MLLVNIKQFLSLMDFPHAAVYWELQWDLGNVLLQMRDMLVNQEKE